MKKLNLFSNLWSLLVGAQSSDVVVTSDGASDEHPMSIRSASDGTSWKHAGNLWRVCAVVALLLTIGVGDAWADYTITFKTSGTTSLINSGGTYATSTEKAYVSGTATGVQFGSNSKGGNIELTMTASGQITASKITLNGYYKPSSKGGDCKCTITYTDNSSTSSTVTATTTATNTDVSLNSSKTLKSIKLESTAKEKKFYVTGVKVTAAVSCTSLDMSVVTATPGNGQIALSWSAVSHADSYTVSCINKSTTAAAGTGTGSGKTGTSCTITGLTNGTEYTWSVMPVGDGSTYCADNTPATGDATPNIYYTVTWNNHGSTSTSSVANGEKPTFPATPSSCDATCTTFHGWATAAWSGPITSLAGKTIYTKASDMPAVTGPVTYYAVYSDATITEYTFTSSSWAATSGGSAANWTSGKAGAGYTEGQGVQVTTTASGANATSPTSFSNVNKVIVTYNTNKTAGVGSIGIKIGSNTEVSNAVAYDSGITDDGRTADFTTEYTFSPVQTGSIKLTANTTTNSIWPKAIKIYSGEATPHYLTTCCTSLGSINGSVSWSSVSSSSSTATLSWANNSNVNSYSVTCKASGASAGSVGSITGTTTKSCAITGLTPGTEYTFTINATGKSGYCDASQEIVAKAPKITAGSASGTSTYIAGSGPGSIQTFTVSGAGLTGNLTVTAPTNFLVSTDNGSSWSTSGGSKTITVSTPPSDLASTTVKFRLAADLSENSYGPSDITISGGNAASVTVAVSGTVSPACSAPTITAHPTGGVTYRVNVTATALSVTATKNGTGPDLTYQWYSNTSNSNTSGSLISGATSRTYTPPTSTPGTKYYYCEVSSGACMTPSNCAAITVSTPTITVSETSRAFGNKAKDSSSTMTFTVSGSNLGANIGLAISGTNAAMFSIDKTSLTHSSGTVSTQTITVTYNPTAVGSHTAQINITSTGATTKTVSLSGTGAWKVDWYVGGTDSDYKLTSGSQSTVATNGSNVSDLTYPISSQTTIDCGDKTFVGWTNTSSYTHGTSPLFTKTTATGTITGNVAYYAVFAESEVDEAELTNAEITSTYVGSGDGATTSYADRSITSASGTWSGKFTVNKSSDEYYVGISSDNSNRHLGSPTFTGNINNITIIGRHNAGSTRNIYVCSSNATAKPTSGDIGSGSIAAVEAGTLTEWTEVSITPSGSHTSFYVYADGGLQIQSISVTYGAYSEHDITCTTCNKVTVSYSDPSHATLSVKKSAAVISSGTQVSTCSSQTLTVKVTPDAANHYWMTAISISGVTGVTTDPSTTSGLPTKEQKSYSVTIPKDATGTLTITPTIEAIPQKTISFLVNGDDAEDNSPQDVYVGEKPELPTVPDDNELSCAEAFVGWSTNELTETGNVEPADLFFTSTATPTVTNDVTYHAVFASKDGSKSGKYTLDYSAESSLSGSSDWDYGKALEYTATDGSAWTVKANKNSGMQINSGKNSSIKIPDCPSGATITTIEITGLNGKAVGFSNDDYSGSGTISYVVKGTDATSQTLDLRGQEVTGGYIVPVTNAERITKIVVNYAKYKDFMTYCTKIFTDAAAANHNWSTAGNWSAGTVPTINERAVINKPVVVDVATAKAKEVILNQSSGNTGSLEISAGKELTIAKTLRKTTDGTNYVATAEGDIKIGSSSAGNGALIIGSHTGSVSELNKATVNFYTKSQGAKDDKASVNQYVGTPISDGNILYNWYGAWTYEVQYNSGADPNWKRVRDGSMTPFAGYCVIYKGDAGHVFEMGGTLLSSDDQTIDLVNNVTDASVNSKNENVLANSWTAPISIKALGTSEAFTNCVNTVYIFNSGSENDIASAGAASQTATGRGQWITIPVNSVSWSSPTVKVIPSMQSFSVYSTGSGAQVKLDYSAVVYDPAAKGDADAAIVANRAPSRTAERDNDDPEVLRLYVNGASGYGDQVVMLGREEFTEGFDNGWDGHKLFGEDAAPQLYAQTTDGIMAVNCVPEIEGTLLGFRKGSEDDMYTFTFDYDGEEVWYLNDLKTEQSTRIDAGNTYTFSSASNDNEARFIISATPIHKVPTGVEHGEAVTTVVRKLLIDDHVYIIRNGRMYDATGVMVR